MTMKFIWSWLILTIMSVICLPVKGNVNYTNSTNATTSCRNPLTNPFLSTSIWNTPIGSGAVFHDPGIFRSPFPLPSNFFSDDDYFIVTSSNDPLTPWYNQGWWGNPNGMAHCNITGGFFGTTHFPENATVTAFDNNNAAALLQPDNHTIINTQPLYRCTPGSPVLSLVLSGVTAEDDIVSGSGTYGAHGGSGLSSIGGTIRLGELLPNTPPIQHALKLELFAYQYYYNQTPGYVWPALNCDGYAFDPSTQYPYGGTDIYLSPGALLAIPSNITVNVTTVPGQKMLFALQNYGGYLCDDTYNNRGTVCTEHGVTDEFQATYGYAFDSGPTSSGAAWYADMLALFQALHVVINNHQNTIGGGGTPLQRLAPPVCHVGVQSSGSGRSVTVQVITLSLTFFSCMNIYSFY